MKSYKSFQQPYDIGMAVLSIIAIVPVIIGLLFNVDNKAEHIFNIVDMATLIIFAIDYCIRLIKADKKIVFVKDNLFDLVAIIPFDSIFRLARLTRLMKLTRLLKITKVAVYFKRLSKKTSKFLNTNGFIYMLYVTITTILIGATGIYLTEKGTTVDSIGDAIWWSFVTATTVGYGDISPVTTLGRVMAGFLMITGIGFIGMLTGTIATYFIGLKTSSNTTTDTLEVDISDLDETQRKEVVNFIEFIRSKK